MNLYAILVVGTPLASVVGVNEAMTLTGDMLAAESRTELLVPMYLYLLLWFFAYCYPIARATRRARAPLPGALMTPMPWTPDQPLVRIADVHKAFGAVTVLKRRLA